MALNPGARLGPYDILGAIGAGGMGEVYRARDTRLDREVAVKILPAEFAGDPDRRARFEREARAVAALNHPNIVTLYEVGTDEAGPYLVLEKIEGRSLAELLGTGPLPVRRLAALAAQIADGLAKAHAAGIVHRDLKPDNVMVTDDGVAKILDFGLAKIVWPELDAANAEQDTTLARDTASGMILGTLGYLSPEQAAGRPADFRADQFALGALLYELATGTRPFRRATMAESLTATIREEPEPLGSKRADLPAPFCWIVERCLAKDPNDRYASTRDLARDLADVRDRLSDLTRGTASTGTPGPGAVMAPARRRAPLVWVLGVLGAAALVALGVAIGRQFAQAAPLPPPTYRALTFQHGIITGARFAPDGKTIYYSAAFGADPSRVFVTRVDEAVSEPLKLPPAMLLSVSRKGELAVLLTDGRNYGTSVGTLARVSALGGTPRALAENVTEADWAPDGEHLVVVGADSSIQFPIGHTIATGFWPRFSPRGDHLAWSGGEGVTIANVDGTSLVVGPFAYGLAWAPGGRELWFTGSTGGGLEDRVLYALSLDGTRRLIASAPGALTVLDVAPDDHGALVYTGTSWLSIVASRQGENRNRSLDLLGRSRLVGLSADGKWLLVYEERTVGRGGYLLSTDGAKTIRLGDEAPIGLSPDGHWVLARSTTDQSHLELQPTAAGSSQVLPPIPGLMALFLAPAQWSADGRRLFVAFFDPRAHADTSTRVYMREGEGPWRAVTPAGPQFNPFAVSPDGRVIAMAGASGTVTLFPVDGGTPRVLEGERGLPIEWSPDGRWLFLRGGSDLTANVYRRELSTGHIEPWRTVQPTDLSGATTILDMVLSADGSLCVYTYARASQQLFLVEGVR
jgi:eukaryotic-like serine/threonine-protein kinase